MQYMIIIQDSKVVGTCFGHIRCAVRDGATSVGLMNSQGKMLEMHCGQLVNGHFDPEDSGEASH